MYQQRCSTVYRVLYGPVPEVLREVCETEKRKPNGLPLPKWSGDKTVKESEQIKKLDVTALARHLLNPHRILGGHDYRSFFVEAGKATISIKELPGSTNTEKIAVLVDPCRALVTKLVEKEDVFVSTHDQKPSTCFATCIEKIVGTKYYLNHTTNNVRGSVVVYRPTAAWIDVNLLKTLRNTHAHLPSIKVSNTYHTEVLRSVRGAVEELEDSELISKTCAENAYQELDEIERGMS